MKNEGADPRLAAVEAELSKDRGELADPDAYHEAETQNIGVRHEDLGSLIAKAAQVEKDHERQRSGLNTRLSWQLILRILSFGLWKPKREPRKDYTIEYDPKTGGYHRVYVVRDGKK